MQSASIVEAEPVDDFIHHGTPRREARTVQSCDLQRIPQAFGRRITQQSPRRLIDERMPYALRVSWKSPLQYWLPRSLWKITP